MQQKTPEKKAEKPTKSEKKNITVPIKSPGAKKDVKKLNPKLNEKENKAEKPALIEDASKRDPIKTPEVKKVMNQISTILIASF